MKRGERHLLQRLWRSKLFLYLADTGFVVFGYYMAFQIKFWPSIPWFNFAPFLRLIPWICLEVLVIFWLFELYSGIRRQIRESVGTVILAVISLNLATMALAFFDRGFSFPRSVFAYATVLQLLFIGCWRAIYRTSENIANGSVILVGTEFLDNNEHIIRAITSVFGKKSKVMIRNVEADGEIDDQFIRYDLSSCHAVFLGASVNPMVKKRIIYESMRLNKEVYLVPEVYDIILNHVRLNRLSDYPVLQLGSLRLTSTHLAIKRVLDLTLALLGLILALPLMLLIAIAIAISSPGPIFYCQERVGYNGKKFTLIKFRSMICDAEETTGPVLAEKRDPRVTKVGALLRDTHLDELPQLINVIKGEMSFVGPRPERPYFVERFAKEIPEYSYRHLIKPGITGLAQVRGKYDTDPSNKLRFDLYYLRNCSLILDLRIILQNLRQIILPETRHESRSVTTKSV